MKNLVNFIDEATDCYKPEVWCIGYDRYCLQEKEYYECYAKMANACYYQYMLKNDYSYFQTGLQYISRLIELARIDPSNGFICWGLPFDNWIHDKNSGALICNAFALEAIMKYNNDHHYDGIIRSAYFWMESLRVDTNSIGYYLYSYKIKEDIYNAEIIAIYILLKICCYFRMDNSKHLEQLERLVKTQSKEGFWYYSPNREDVDMVHQAYCVEYLLKSIKIISVESNIKKFLLDYAKKGLSFLQQNMWNAPTDRYLFRLSDSVKIKTRLKYFLLRILYLVNPNNKKFLPKQAWSCAAALQASCEAVEIFGKSSYPDNIIRYIQDFLIDEHGVIKFTEKSDKHFVRHSAHIIEALAYSHLLK